MKIRVDVGDGARELFFGGDVGFGALALLKNGLSFLLILPETGIVDFWFEGFQKVAAGRNVKDNSERVRCAFSIPQSALPGLPRGGLLA
jgi:hypothetical protein